MTAMMTSMIRPIPIILECDTGRVPFGLMPVTAATATMTTAIPSNTSQFMVNGYYKIGASVGSGE